jgi:phosphate transport system substrate-binding protein
MTNQLKQLTIAAAVAVAAVTVSAQTVKITGAGATFPYPIYSKWFSEYNKLHPNVEINYQSIGSGGGIRQITNKTVFFGASDGPMTQEQLDGAPGKILHFPTVLGADVPVYNIPGVSTQLKFTGPVLADIFLGKITKWNDPALAKLNQGVNLPGTDITVVHRSDGSGTTYIWVDYLAKVSPEWKQKIGVSTSVNWPVGLGGKGNEFIAASTESVTAAAAAAANQMPADFRVSITNPPGDAAYPISSFTWLLLYENPQDKAQAKIMVDFMNWALTDGQKFASGLGYAPLPQNVIEMEKKALQKIKL